MTRALFALTLACLLFAMAPVALAQAPSIDPELRAEGERLQAEALAHVDAERWGLAAETYERVYDIARRAGSPRAPVALWDRGLALMRIPGREAEARASFQRFLDESTPLTEDAEIRDWRSTALEHIAELNARIGSDEPETSSNDPEGAPAPTAPDPVPTTSVSPAGPIVLGVGGAMLIAGAITGGLALAEHGTITSMCNAETMRCPPDLQERADDLAALSIATDVLLWGGLAIAATGAILTFVLRDGGSDATVRASCGSTGCAAVLTGSY